MATGSDDESVGIHGSLFLKMYTDWANCQLQRLVPRIDSELEEERSDTRLITSLTSDCRDGVLLADIIQSVSCCSVEGVTRHPVNHEQMIDNIGRCLQALRHLGINVDGVQATDIAAGNCRSILIVFIGLSRYKQQRQRRPLTSVSSDDSLSSSTGSRNSLNWAAWDTCETLSWEEDAIMKRLPVYDRKHQRARMTDDMYVGRQQSSAPDVLVTSSPQSKCANIIRLQTSDADSRLSAHSRGGATVRVTQLPSGAVPASRTRNWLYNNVASGDINQPINPDDQKTRVAHSIQPDSSTSGGYNANYDTTLVDCDSDNTRAVQRSIPTLTNRQAQQQSGTAGRRHHGSLRGRGRTLCLGDYITSGSGPASASVDVDELISCRAASKKTNSNTTGQTRQSVRDPDKVKYSSATIGPCESTMPSPQREAIVEPDEVDDKSSNVRPATDLVSSAHAKPEEVDRANNLTTASGGGFHTPVCPTSNSDVTRNGYPRSRIPPPPRNNATIAYGLLEKRSLSVPPTDVTSGAHTDNYDDASGSIVAGNSHEQSNRPNRPTNLPGLIVPPRPVKCRSAPPQCNCTESKTAIAASRNVEGESKATELPPRENSTTATLLPTRSTSPTVSPRTDHIQRLRLMNAAASTSTPRRETPQDFTEAGSASTSADDGGSSAGDASLLSDGAVINAQLTEDTAMAAASEESDSFDDLKAIRPMTLLNTPSALFARQNSWTASGASTSLLRQLSSPSTALRRSTSAGGFVVGLHVQSPIEMFAQPLISLSLIQSDDQTGNVTSTTTAQDHYASGLIGSLDRRGRGGRQRRLPLTPPETNRVYGSILDPDKDDVISKGFLTSGGMQSDNNKLLSRLAIKRQVQDGAAVKSQAESLPSHNVDKCDAAHVNADTSSISDLPDSATVAAAGLDSFEPIVLAVPNELHHLSSFLPSPQHDFRQRVGSLKYFRSASATPATEFPLEDFSGIDLSGDLLTKSFDRATLPRARKTRESVTSAYDTDQQAELIPAQETCFLEWNSMTSSSSSSPGFQSIHSRQKSTDYGFDATADRLRCRPPSAGSYCHGGTRLLPPAPSAVDYSGGRLTGKPTNAESAGNAISRARSDFYQPRRDETIPGSAEPVGSVSSVWNDFPTPLGLTAAHQTAGSRASANQSHMAVIRLGVNATSARALASGGTPPTPGIDTPLTGSRTHPPIADVDEERLASNTMSPTAGDVSVGNHVANGNQPSMQTNPPSTGNGTTSARHRGSGAGIYGGSLPRLGSRSTASSTALQTVGNAPVPVCTAFSTSVSMPVGASSGLGGRNMATGNGWWTMRSSGGGGKDSDGSSSCIACGSNLTPPNRSTSKDNDLHGSALSLISNTSSVFSTPEEKQNHEVRRLTRDLEQAHDKINTLTSQLSANAHVVAAFEQSLSNMTQRLQKLTTATERKDAELSELRAKIQTLQRQSQTSECNVVALNVPSSTFGGGTERGDASSDSELSVSSACTSPSIRASVAVNGSAAGSRCQSAVGGYGLSSAVDPHQQPPLTQLAAYRYLQQQQQQQFHGHTLPGNVSSTIAELNKKRLSWLGSSFRKAFSRRKAKRQQNSFDAGSPGGAYSTIDDVMMDVTSVPSSPSLAAGASNGTYRHSSTPSTPLTVPRRRSSSTVVPNSDLDSLIVDVVDPEQLVLRLGEQLHEKDMKLTEVRLEALTSVHQLEQLRETLNRMKVEMLQLRSDNERMQKLISQNGLKELQPAPDSETDVDSLRKKLSIGDPTTFDAIALDSSNKDSQTFQVIVQLSPTVTKLQNTEQLGSDGWHLVGVVSLTSQTQWSTLDETVYRVFKNYLSRIDSSSCLGLSEESILNYRVGEITRVKGSATPELLPCGYLIGDNKDIIVSLKGVVENAVDELAFDTLIPKSMVDRYVSLLLDHRRLILCGPSGTGKTFLARRLANHIAHICGRQDETSAVEVFNVDHKSCRELRQYLANIVSSDVDNAACSLGSNENDAVSTSGVTPSSPAVIVIDNLHLVMSLADTFSAFFADNVDARRRPYVIGTMRPIASTPVTTTSGQTSTMTTAASELQLTHHNFRWVLLSNHSEPVRGLLCRHLQRNMVASELAAVRPEVNGASTAGNRRSECPVAVDEMERVVAWLPKVWNHLNRFIETHGSSDVTLGPRLFLSCPMNEYSSQVWFADLWNYSIVPYLLEVLRDSSSQGQSRTPLRDVIDPTDWVIANSPWTTTSPEDWSTTLIRLSVATDGSVLGASSVTSSQTPSVTSEARSNIDGQQVHNQSTLDGSLLESGGSVTETSSSQRPASSGSIQQYPSGNDPLMAMLLKLQEATMCSSIYGVDGLDTSNHVMASSSDSNPQESEVTTTTTDRV